MQKFHEKRDLRSKNGSLAISARSGSFNIYSIPPRCGSIEVRDSKQSVEKCL